MTGALALFTAAHHKFVKVGGAVVHRLHGDDRSRTVAGKTERDKTLKHRDSTLIRRSTPALQAQFCGGRV